MTVEDFAYESELGQAMFGHPTKEYLVGCKLHAGMEIIRLYLTSLLM
jgi:hypothetical protein